MSIIIVLIRFKKSKFLLMKKIFKIVALNFLFCSFLSAQTNNSGQPFFVELNNGTLIKSNWFELKQPFLQGSYVMDDNKNRYFLDSLKSFRVGEGQFKKTDNWYKVEEEGKINLLTKVSDGFVLGNYRNPYQQPYYASLPSHTVMTYNILGSFYCQKGNETPLKMNYVNVLERVRDNPQSVALVNVGHGRKVAKTSLYVIATGLFIGCIATAQKYKAITAAEKKRENLAGTMFLGSLVLPIVALCIKSPKIKYREAVAVYNR